MASHTHWVQFHIGDYLSDTAHLTTIEHGAYLLLLFHYYKQAKPLPNDDKILARVAKMTAAEWDDHKDVILEFFILENGKLVQKRAREILRKSKKAYDQRVNAGRKSAIKRKGLANGRSTAAKREPNGSPTDVGGTRTTKSSRGNTDPSDTGPGGPPPMANHDVLAHSLPPELRDKKPASEIEKTIVPLKEKKGGGGKVGPEANANASAAQKINT